MLSRRIRRYPMPRRLADLTPVVISGLLLAAYCVCAKEPTADDELAVTHASLPPGEPVQIVPWIEVNTLDERDTANAVEGLLFWRRVTDTAIVSTVGGCSALYPRLRQRVPDMRIIPGLKTNDFLTQFDDLEGWRKVGREVKAICQAAVGDGPCLVLLENESASRDELAGREELDSGRLREGLKLAFPTDQSIEVIWYPSMVGETEKTQQCAERLCQAAADTLSVRFTDLSMGGPKSLGNRWSKRGKQTLDRLAKKQTIPMLYFYGPGSRWWQDEQIKSALTLIGPPPTKRSGGRWVIIYPGAKHWTKAARSISNELSQ